MSYTELESGYQDLRQQSSQQAAAVSSQTLASGLGNTSGSGERSHQRPGFFVGHDGNVICFSFLLIITNHLLLILCSFSIVLW